MKPPQSFKMPISYFILHISGMITEIVNMGQIFTLEFNDKRSQMTVWTSINVSQCFAELQAHTYCTTMGDVERGLTLLR